MKLDKKTISLIIVFAVVVSIIAIATSYISGYHLFGDVVSDGMSDFMGKSMKSSRMHTHGEFDQELNQLNTQYSHYDYNYSRVSYMHPLEEMKQKMDYYRKKQIEKDMNNRN
ncbi:MAG: hypothetical protein LBM96_11210 [Methanobrevibacter sp.]|jgi:hypothetical protein|nr:hypothetical protein [Candidatus Methanoflexus mossambicus]